MPNATFSHSATTHVPREKAWTALDRPETWESVAGVDRVFDPVFDLNNRLTGFSFETMVAGSPYQGKASPRERVEGKLMAWNILSAHVRGHTQVELADEGDHTLVTVTAYVESVGFLASMMFSSISAAIGGGMDRTVQEFAESLGNSTPLT